jgi:hypothetical protein
MVKKVKRVANSSLITGLNKFLSTENRRKVFLYYVFSEISPSNLVKEAQIPFSTVDRITQLLKAHNILLEAKGKDAREKNYTVNFDRWVEENLEFIGLDFLEQEQIKKVIDFMKNKTFFTVSYFLTNSEFVLRFFEEPLKIGDDIIFLPLMQLNESMKTPASLPSYILIFLRFAPSFKKLAKDIENKFLEKDILLINKEIEAHPFIKNVDVDVDSLTEFEKNRNRLIDLIGDFFEKKILKMSVDNLKKQT